MNDHPEAIRILYKYRKLIREGKVMIPEDDAKKLIGADSVYHLYGAAGTGKKMEKGRKKK